MFFIFKLHIKIVFFKVKLWPLLNQKMTVLMIIMDLCIIAQSLTTTMSAMQLLKSLSDCLLINPMLTIKRRDLL